MQVRATEDDGLPVLQIDGEIDLHESPALRTVLQNYAKKRTPALAVDLSGVGYIDSSGLATFVEYVRSTREFGGRLALLGLTARVRTIFDLVRLGEILPIVRTLAEARAALLAPPA